METFASHIEARLALRRRAAEAQPRSADALFLLANALADAEAYDEYAEVYRRAFLLAPRLQLMGGDRSELLRAEGTQPDRIGEAARMRDRARALIQRGVAFTPVIAGLAIAESVLGNADEVARLIDCGAFLRSTALAAPPGFEGEDFHAMLAAEIRRGLKQHRLPWGAIKAAARNSRVMESALPACRAITGAIRTEVERYIAQLPTELDHPFAAARPAAFVMTGWSVLIDGKSRHIAHTHPRAWLSGVYYVVRPAASRAPGTHNGWLRVGAPTSASAPPGWEERWIEPEPGTLVLMPGYFYHETTPTRSDEERLCIAFDVMPPDLAPDARILTGPR